MAVVVAVAVLLRLAIFFKQFSYARFAFMIAAVQKPLSLDRRAIALARRLAQYIEVDGEAVKKRRFQSNHFRLHPKDTYNIYNCVCVCVFVY